MTDSSDADLAAADAELVGALCEIEEGLSDWEMEFVESIRRQLEALREASKPAVLTDRQRKKALEIATEMDV